MSLSPGLPSDPAPRRAAAESTDQTTLAAGETRTIGRYRLTRKLGSGSFATVWQGHDDDLDVPVAVKVLADNWADNEDVRNRFLTEARIMRRISDPRIVRVYDIGSMPDGRPYFVMDYADGGSLDALRRERIAPVRALRLCADACHAMQALHNEDIVHRDVTPGNILLHRTSQGDTRVLIADLGVAKAMVGESGATMTAGTPAYMAIEQGTGGPFDHRADVYSLGAVTYAMLTGRPPFGVRTLADLLRRDPHEPVPPIAAQVGAPPSLDAVLASALSGDPNQRPQTADALGDALDRVADELESGRWTPSTPPPPTAGGWPTPGSYLQGSATSGRPAPAPSFPPGSTPGSGLGGPRPPLPGPSGPAHHSMVQPPRSTLQPPPGSTIQPPAATSTKRDRGVLFYVFVGIAALALFFLSLLITVLVIN